MSIAEELRVAMLTSHSVSLLERAADHIDALEAQVKALKNGHRTYDAQLLSGAFELFWAAYPRKVGKVACCRSWRRMKLDDMLCKILDALAEHKRSKSWQKNGGEFIPHPTTWINQRRWEDELHQRL